MHNRYDLCVIGAGTAGFAAAERARAQGRNVLVVTGPGALGGTCILRGCMPAKTLLSATETLRDVERAPEIAAPLKDIQVDLPALIERKRELVDYFAEDRVAELKTYPLLRGAARFLDERAVEVGGSRIEAERFIIATGSRIVAPAVPGLRENGFVTSDQVLEMKQVPPSVAILGGGPVGCEFAQYFARLGARVSLFEEGPTLLRKEDPDIGTSVLHLLRAEGVAVYLDARIHRVDDVEGGRLVTLEGTPKRDIKVTLLMVATGRVPNITGLSLECAGIDVNAGAIVVDEHLRTSNPAVFAAGDVLGRRCLVHVAEYAGKLAVDNAFSQSPKQADFDRFEAHGVYTQPQVAVAGLTERACMDRGITYAVKHHPFRDVGKALVSNEAEGYIKMIAADDGLILGVSIFGDNAIDLIGEAIALIDRGATVRDVVAMPHLHPTLGEIYGRVAQSLVDAAS